MKLDRRTILKTATPVIATVISKSVSANSLNGCIVASSFVSVATFVSRNPGASASCTNQTIESWKYKIQNGEEVVGTVRNLLGFPDGSYGNMLVKDVLTADVQTAGEFGVVQHLSALALSIQSGSINPGMLNMTYLQGVWQSYKTNQPNYVSPSNITMSEGQLIGWLRALMGYTLVI